MQIYYTNMHFTEWLESVVKNTLLEKDSFLSVLCAFYVIFSILNISVLTERKWKYAILIILLIPCFAFAIKYITGFDAFYAINEFYISFALSIYSFVNSLINELKYQKDNGVLR